MNAESAAPDAWDTAGLPRLNVADVCPATRALGPGLRAVVWVQGCPFHCTECIAPEWIPRRQGRLVAPDALADDLLRRADIRGVTLSGGEPMMQARGLAALCRRLRARQPNLDVICFTGFTRERLEGPDAPQGARELLAEVDVLIDGPYVEGLDDARGLRGSSNQRIHDLTDRLRGQVQDAGPRSVEFHVRANDVLLVGIPPKRLPLLELAAHDPREPDQLMTEENA